jgi:hypothetical protein
VQKVRTDPFFPLAKAMEAFVAVGQKMWRRTDGAILWLRSSSSVRLELPAAREHEAKLKAEKEQKARSSVPHVLSDKRKK